MSQTLRLNIGEDTIFTIDEYFKKNKKRNKAHCQVAVRIIILYNKKHHQVAVQILKLYNKRRYQVVVQILKLTI